MSGLEKYQDSYYEEKLPEYYLRVENKGLVDNGVSEEPGFMEYNAQLNEKLFERTTFENRTKYYFEDYNLMQSSANRYEAISRDNESINAYSKKYTYHGARKRKGYAKEASGKFKEAAALEERHQIQRGTAPVKNDYALYKHREKVIRLRMEAMINVAMLKSKDEKDEAIRILKAKHVCLLALMDQLKDIQSHRQTEKDAEKLAKASEKLSLEIEQVEKSLASNIGIKRNNAPGADMLVTDYGGSFRSRVTENARRSKKINSKSRLFAKEQNSKSIKDAAKRLDDKNNAAMKKAIAKKYLAPEKKETYQALSAFMQDAKNARKNLELLNDFVGIEKDAKTGEVRGQNRKKAMDYVTAQLLNINIRDISFKNDADIVANAEKMEDIVRKVSAYDKLCKMCPDYMTSLSDKRAEKLSKRLSILRDMGNFYNARKDILNDEYYKDHYNEELSMNIDKDSTLAQKAVALKLMKSYILGLRLIKRSGDSILTAPPIAMYNKETRLLYEQALLECNIRKQTEKSDKKQDEKQDEKQQDIEVAEQVKEVKEERKEEVKEEKKEVKEEKKEINKEVKEDVKVEKKEVKKDVKSEKEIKKEQEKKVKEVIKEAAKKEVKKEEKKEEKKAAKKVSGYPYAKDIGDNQALPKFKVNCPVKVKYEKQRKHNCFACSGTAMMNQFILNQENKLSNPYGQLDLRGYKLKYKTLDEIRKYMPEFNETNYYENRRELELKTNLISEEFNSIFDMADFFVTKRKDLCVNRIIYDIPSGKVADRGQQLTKMKTHFLQHAKSVLESGNFLSVRRDDHYMTVVGIEGDKLKVLNSIKGSNEDPNEPETYSLDYIMGLTNTKGIANNYSPPFEVTYLEKMKEPQEVLKEVEGVTYDEKQGFDNAQNISKELAYEIANLPGQTQGVLGRKKIQGAADVNIAHHVYLPKLDSAQKNAAIKEAIPEYGRVSEWKMQQYVDNSLNNLLNHYSTLKI